MMSSVDLTSSSAGTSSAQRTAALNYPNSTPHHMQPHPQSRYATHHIPGSHYHHHHQQQQHIPYNAGGAAPAGAEAGRLKTEQVVLEFLFKVAELVLQSRVHFQSEPGHHTPSTRRGRFNLDIDEIQYVRDAMASWRQDVHLPLTIDVYYDAEDSAAPRVLLEKWSVVYTNGFATASTETSSQFDPLDFHGRRTQSQQSHYSHSGGGGGGTGNTRDVIQVLKEVLKKFTIQLRALHCFMRLLPAHRFFRQSYPSTLSYEIHAASSGSSYSEREREGGVFEQGISTSQYSFVPINTPFGFVKVSTVYRRDCGTLEKKRTRASNEIFQENFIIQDYVPASPELVPASRQSPASSPLRIPSSMPPPASSSPLSIRRYVEDSDTMEERRRRSSPELVVEGGRTTAVMKSPQLQPQKQHLQQQQQLSQPMAIPQQIKTPVAVVSFDAHEEQERLMMTTASTTKPIAIIQQQPQQQQQHQQHAHSYGDPGRLRTLNANPNVTPAPYGYGNVAIERGMTPPLPMGGGATSTTSSGFSAGAGAGGSYQDHGAATNLSSPHPLSTPPRHPHSLLTPRTMGARTSFVSSMTSSTTGGGGGRRSSNEYAYRASLENFSLDTSSPSNMALSPSPQHGNGNGSRADTFNFDSSVRSRTIDQADASSRTRNSRDIRTGSPSSSPQLTPPFMAQSPPVVAHTRLTEQEEQSTTAALVVRHLSLTESQATRDQESSPLVQANATELLSTSPGYSHNIHFQTLRRTSLGGAAAAAGGGASSSASSSSSTPPPFLSTDSAARTSNGSFRGSSEEARGGALLFSTSLVKPTMTLLDTKARAFSTDIDENTAGIWGISPDTQDGFAFSIGATTRRRFLSSASDPRSRSSGSHRQRLLEGTSSSRASQDDGHDDAERSMDSEMMLLPFAISPAYEADNLSTATTVTTTGSSSMGGGSGGRPSSSLSFGGVNDTGVSGGGIVEWDTASVGSFLQQLKNAPRLQHDHEAPSSLSHTATSTTTATTGQVQPSFFDDELESFRSLRNEMAQTF